MGRKKQMELDAPWLDLEGKIASEVLHAPKTGGDPDGEWACAPDRVVGVNARVNLRRNNFVPLVRWLFLSTIDTLQSSLSRLLCQTADRTATPPCGRSSPPGHAVVDGWRRDERTRDILQRNPRSLVSSANPTTGVQVLRPAALQCLNSLTPYAKRAGFEG